MPTLKTPLIALTAWALLASAPAHSATTSLTVRASGSLAGNVGPIMELRINGSAVGKIGRAHV